jgi:hypothetical protein
LAKSDTRYWTIRVDLKDPGNGPRFVDIAEVHQWYVKFDSLEMHTWDNALGLSTDYAIKLDRIARIEAIRGTHEARKEVN